MPLYDFHCGECGGTFEARTAHDELPPCPSCGSADTKRVFSPFAGPFTVGLKGSAARRSNASRRSREEQRQERREQRKERGKQRGERGKD